MAIDARRSTGIGPIEGYESKWWLRAGYRINGNWRANDTITGDGRMAEIKERINGF